MVDHPGEDELVCAQDDAALQLLELRPEGDHADEDDTLLAVERVLVLEKVHA